MPAGPCVGTLEALFARLSRVQQEKSFLLYLLFMYTCIHTYMYMHVHTCTCTHMYTHTCTHIHVHTCTCIHTVIIHVHLHTHSAMVGMTEGGIEMMKGSRPCARGASNPER